MKNILTLIILFVSFQGNLFGQDFKKSKTLTLSKIDTTTIKLPNDSQDNNRTIYLKKTNNENLKKFNVYLDSYDEENSFVEEITETQLNNVRKIIKVIIEHCGCGCSDDIYYWLVTENDEWIELPKIEHFNIDIGNTYQEYVFKKDYKTTIELVEFREKLNENKPNKKNPTGFEIERVYEKKIKTLTWNGNELQGLDEKYIATAENGLLVRDKPSLRSKKIGKLYFGAQITIISKTRFTETITDNGKKIKGNWVKIKFSNSPIHISTNVISNENYGYVFDGYLEKKSDNLDRIANELRQFDEFENLQISKNKSPYYLKGDFFGDDISDIAVLLKDKKGTTKIGIVNYHKNNSVHILGNKNDPFKIYNYSWVGIFEKVNTGEVLWSNYDEDKDDLVDFKDIPKNEKVKLNHNAIYVHADESCGGGFIYWKNGKFNWLQQE